MDTLKKADRITRRHHSDFVTLERAIFLSWWCDKGDCSFCFMSTQKDRIKDPKTARRKLSALLAEVELCARIGWEVEFLSGGYGAYSVEEIKGIAEMVAHIMGSGTWLNTGVLKNTELETFGEEVKGVIGSVETVNKELHDRICPSKPLEPVIEMLGEAKDMGLKTGITIVLGLGEKGEDIYPLFDLIRELDIDRVTFYSLNPHEGTAYAASPPPASIYQAGVIALTRLEFPKIKLIGGTWIDQLSNIGIMLLAGANGITKYPLFTMFGTRYGKKVEGEVRSANRRLLGTFAELDVLKGIRELPPERTPTHVFGRAAPKVSPAAMARISELRGEIDGRIGSYVKEVEKNLKHYQLP